MLYSCQKFYHDYYDIDIVIVTDYKPILSLFTVNSSLPPHIQKCSLKLQECHFKLSYIEEQRIQLMLFQVLFKGVF